MDFQTLAIISVIALLGPMLATPRRWNIPVAIGQLAAGVIVGRTGFDLIDAADPTLTLLADVGFALIMFVAGTHVPVRSGAIRAALSAGLVLAWLERNGSRVRLPKLSANRKFALELRIQLAILFALSAVAVFSQVSVMLAGFAVGLAVAAVGEPRRLARQLFALADGFFGPLFFVWLGASRALRDLAEHPQMIVLGLSLGLATLLTHATTRVLGLPLSFGRLPVIAVTAVASGWAQPRAASVPK